MAQIPRQRPASFGRSSAVAASGRANHAAAVVHGECVDTAVTGKRSLLRRLVTQALARNERWGGGGLLVGQLALAYDFDEAYSHW